MRFLNPLKMKKKDQTNGSSSQASHYGKEEPTNSEGKNVTQVSLEFGSSTKCSELMSDFVVVFDLTIDTSP